MNTPSPKYCNPRYALQILQKIHDSGLLSLATWGADLEIIRIVLSAARPTGAEVAALLRELAVTSDHHAAHLQGDRYTNWAQQTRDNSARARAMAEKLQPTQEQS